MWEYRLLTRKLCGDSPCSPSHSPPPPPDGPLMMSDSGPSRGRQRNETKRVSSRRQRPVVAHAVVAVFGRVLAQAELGRADDFVVVRPFRALERGLERVDVPAGGGGGGGRGGGPAGAVLDGSLAGAAGGGGGVEEAVEEGSQGGQGDEGDGRQVLGDGADGGLPQRPGEVLGEDALEQDRLGHGAAGRQGAEADEAAQGRLGAPVHLQPVEDGDGDRGADEVREGVEAEPDVPGQVRDVGREALAPDARVPDGGHRPALHEEQHHLRQVAGRAKGDHDPQEGRQVLPRPADDPQHAQADGYLGQPDADVVAYLRNDAPFQHQGNLFGGQAVDVPSHADEDEFRQAAHPDGARDLEKQGNERRAPPPTKNAFLEGFWD